jgi:hypothetical protein
VPRLCFVHMQRLHVKLAATMTSLCTLSTSLFRKEILDDTRRH